MADSGQAKTQAGSSRRREQHSGQVCGGFDDLVKCHDQRGRPHKKQGQTVTESQGSAHGPDSSFQGLMALHLEGDEEGSLHPVDPDTNPKYKNQHLQAGANSLASERKKTRPGIHRLKSYPSVCPHLNQNVALLILFAHQKRHQVLVQPEFGHEEESDSAPR